MGSAQSEPTLKVGYRTKSYTTPYAIRYMEVRTTKHPGVHSTSPGLWEVMPHDVLSIGGSFTTPYRLRIRGTKDIAYFRCHHKLHPDTMVFIKVHCPKYYEYDKYEVLDFSPKDWSSVWKYTVYD